MLLGAVYAFFYGLVFYFFGFGSLGLLVDDEIVLGWNCDKKATWVGFCQLF
jgi:hypothetical protein